MPRKAAFDVMHHVGRLKGRGGWLSVRECSLKFAVWSFVKLGQTAFSIDTPAAKLCLAPTSVCTMPHAVHVLIIHDAQITEGAHRL